MAELKSGHEMSLLEHLGELRQRLVKCVLLVFAAFFVCYAFHVELFNFVSAPIQEGLVRHGIYQFRAIQVTEPMMVYLKVSFVGALVIGSPYLIAQTWFFVAPGLLSNERRLVLPIVFFGTVFFLLGIAFCYRIVLPVITDFLVGVGEESTSVAVDVTLQSALTYALTFLLVFGAIFELPMVLFFMTLLGMVTPKQLIAFGRYWIVISFIIGAFVTPPDPVSQLMMAIPLVLLYGVGTATSFLAYRRVEIEVKQEEEGTGSGVAAAWSTAGAVMLAGVLLGFIWVLLPRYEHDALFYADRDSPVLLGMQPHVLHRHDLWAPLGARMAEAFPEIRSVLTDPGLFPDLVIYESDAKGVAVLILSGMGLEEKILSLLPERIERRSEGAVHLFGTLAALRGTAGELWACVGSICLVGPAIRVLKKVRLNMAGITVPEDIEDLYMMQESGPFWGSLGQVASSGIVRHFPGSLPPTVGRATFSFGADKDGISEILLSLFPKRGSDLETLAKDAGKLEGMASFGAQPADDALFQVRDARTIRELIRLEMRREEREGQARAQAFSLRVPSLEGLIKASAAPAAVIPDVARTWFNTIRPFLRVAAGAPEVQVDEGAVRIVWTRALDRSHVLVQPHVSVP